MVTHFLIAEILLIPYENKRQQVWHRNELFFTEGIIRYEANFPQDSVDVKIP